MQLSTATVVGVRADGGWQSQWWVTRPKVDGKPSGWLCRDDGGGGGGDDDGGCAAAQRLQQLVAECNDGPPTGDLPRISFQQSHGVVSIHECTTP